MRCSRLSSFLVIACLMVTTAVAAKNFDMESLAYQKDVVYGHKMGMALTLDVVTPPKQNGAAVLFMVSGGWVSTWFDIEARMDDLGGRLGPFAGLAADGYTLILVRHGSSPLFKVPDAVADVRRAVRYVRLHASDFGIDPDRMGVFGGSAGGHLSLMLGNASDQGNPNSKDPVEQVSNRVAAVVAYFPPVDLQGIVGPSDRFPALDFDPEKADDVSPLLFVTPDDPPTLLIHGDQDTLVTLDNSERILKAFQEKNVKSKLVVIEGAGHGFRGAHQEEAGELLVKWFNKHLSK